MTSAVPSSVYLDTSLVIDAMFTTGSHRSAAADFCAALVANGSTVYFSQLLRVELLHAIRAVGTDPQTLNEVTRRRYRLARWGDRVDVRERWMAYGVSLFDRLLQQFTEVIEIPFHLAAWELANTFMCKYQIKSYDAFHAATAARHGVRDLATADAGYLRVSELTIHLIRDT